MNAKPLKKFSMAVMMCATFMPLARGAATPSDERCYPERPVMILRELMGGVDTEENFLGSIT